LRKGEIEGRSEQHPTTSPFFFLSKGQNWTSRMTTGIRAPRFIFGRFDNNTSRNATGEPNIDGLSTRLFLEKGAAHSLYLFVLEGLLSVNPTHHRGGNFVQIFEPRSWRSPGGDQVYVSHMNETFAIGPPFFLAA
jgi:hypothetical protein